MMMDASTICSSGRMVLLLRSTLSALVPLVLGGCQSYFVVAVHVSLRCWTEESLGKAHIYERCCRQVSHWQYIL